jgi:phenazine biosynthesis protein phzE
VAETHAKAGGILSAFGLVPAAEAPAEGVADLARDEDVLIALNSRNRRLSTFWLTDQAGSPPDPSLRGRSAVILDGEDDFVNMLRHVLGVLGIASTVVRHEDYRDGVLDGFDLVIVGPGPGDPRDDDDAKMQRIRAALDWLLAARQPFLAVCLGQQLLCHRLGIPLVFKDIVFQGTQSPVAIDGRTERVGFYNTFVGRLPIGQDPPAGVTVEADRATGDIHLITGPHYRGIQFHAESILTEHGYELIHDLVRDLLVP